MNLRRRDNRERAHDTIRTFLADLRNQQRSHARTSPSTKWMGQLETLEKNDRNESTWHIRSTDPWLWHEENEWYIQLYWSSASMEHSRWYFHFQSVRSLDCTSLLNKRHKSHEIGFQCLNLWNWEKLSAGKRCKKRGDELKKKGFRRWSF